jgi:hypothetical protein
MKCAVRRWGPGTTQPKQVETEATKLMQERLDAIKQARASQDAMWEESEPVTRQEKNIQHQSSVQYK